MPSALQPTSCDGSTPVSSSRRPTRLVPRLALFVPLGKVGVFPVTLSSRSDAPECNLIPVGDRRWADGHLVV